MAGILSFLGTNPIVRTMGQVGINLLLNSLNGTAQNRNNAAMGGGQNLIAQIAPQYGRYVYSSQTEVTTRIQQKKHYGFTSDVTGNVPAAYIVVIENKQWAIRALMQDQIQISMTGSWTPFVSQDFMGQLQTAAAFVNASFMPRWTTRNIWRGTSPIKLSVKLKLEAIHDARTEVVLACLRLKQMASPGLSKGIGNAVGMLVPPGPAPGGPEAAEFRSWASANLPGMDMASNIIKGVATSTEGDLIMVKYGTFLNFSSVVVTDVSVRYSPKMTPDGYPISAEADVQFQTYQIETKDSLQNDIYTKVGETD